MNEVICELSNHEVKIDLEENRMVISIIILYVIFSKKFEHEVKQQIAAIKEDEEKCLRDAD